MFSKEKHTFLLLFIINVNYIQAGSKRIITGNTFIVNNIIIFELV